jgi:hypothetical protein
MTVAADRRDVDKPGDDQRARPQPGIAGKTTPAAMRIYKGALLAMPLRQNWPVSPD